LIPGDQIRFHLEEDPAPGNEPIYVTVTPLDDVQFPVSREFMQTVVTVKTQKRTLEKIKADLKGQLEADYYFKASIELYLIDRAKQYGVVLFFGAVKGSIPLPPGEKVLISDAMLKLGYSAYANLKKVKIRRMNAETGKEDSIVVNVHDILHKGKRDKDRELLDGDRVEVPEKNFISGF